MPSAPCPRRCEGRDEWCPYCTERGRFLFDRADGLLKANQKNGTTALRPLLGPERVEDRWP